MKKRRVLLSKPKARLNSNVRRRVMKKNSNAKIHARQNIYRLRLIEENEQQNQAQSAQPSEEQS